jgi:Fe-S-cluster containining protein
VRVAAAHERAAGAAPVDYQLLEGFSFHCRTDCGLCCYATPAADAAELVSLRTQHPETQVSPGGGGFVLLNARPNGGSCQFLVENRCGCRDVRPFPCREFPLIVHLGTRAQVALVLSCPGLDLAALQSPARADLRSGHPDGLEEELEAVRRGLEERPIGVRLRRAGARLRRVLRERGLPVDWDLNDLRTNMRADVLTPGRHDFPVPDPPDTGGSLAEAPLSFHRKYGRIAWTSTPDGWALVAVREGGGVERRVGTFTAPDTPPSLAPAGARVLEGYRRYLLRRDATAWMVLGDPAADLSTPLESLLAIRIR